MTDDFITNVDWATVIRTETLVILHRQITADKSYIAYPPDVDVWTPRVQAIAADTLDTIAAELIERGGYLIGDSDWHWDA